jgi:putative hydrolase of the HAD superfamily
MGLIQLEVNAMKWKAALFDLHDTLIDTRASYRESLREMLDLFLGRWSEADDKQIESRIDPLLLALKKVPKASRKSGPPPADYRYKRIKKALEPIGIKVTPEFAETLVKQWNFHQLDASIPFSNVTKTLSELNRHLPIAIVSNSKASIVEKRLKAFSGESWLNQIKRFTPKDGVRKPHPDVFQYALKEMGVSPSESIYIGNSWRNDMKGAINAGMDAVWFNPRHRRRPTHLNCYEIHSFEELLPLILKK